jgi:hypothetical protein
MKMLRGKLNYANATATIALFVALGGSAYAAASLPKNSVGTKQLKAGSVTSAKIKNGAVTGPKVKLSSLGTVPSATSAASAGVAATATNAAALGGSPPSAFAASSVVRSATINSAGSLVPAKSDGVAASNFLHSGEGLYCINGLNPAPRTAVATIDTGAEQGSTVATEIGPPGECQVRIFTYSKAAVDANRPFSLILH